MKKAINFLISLCLILAVCAPFGASALYNSAVEVQSEIYYVASLDTGTVLFEKDALVQASPASLTKIVTSIVALENCEDLETVVTVKEESIRLLDGTGRSLGRIKPGEQISMKNLLYYLLISSANEAAMIIADYIGGGSVEKFVEMMNETAARLGCTNSQFKNPHGLDEDGHYSCARDMAEFAKYAMQFPIFMEITNSKEYTVPATNLQKERKITSTNFMLSSGYKEYYMPEVKGIKTGSTTKAGKCLVTTATKDGYSYIAVVMKAPYYDYDKDGYKENFAFIDCKKMLEWIFDNIKLKIVADPTKMVTEVEVKYGAGKVDHVKLVPQKECTALVPVNVDSQSVYIEPVKGSIPDYIEAPVKKGDVIGEAVIKYAGEEIARVKLVASEDVKRNVVSMAAGKIGNVIKSPGFLIAVAVIVAVILFFIGANIYVNRNRKRKRIKVFNYRDINR